MSPPPYIVPHSEDPPFEATLQYNATDSIQVKVTVADTNVAQTLAVRFCARASAEASSPYLLQVDEITVRPTADHEVERPPIVVQGMDVCNRFQPTSDSRFLYVVVAAEGAFAKPTGCDVKPGLGYDYAFWRYTCDRPQ